MTLRVSGKNMDVGESLREHINDRISDAIEKYFSGGFSGHVTMQPEGSGFLSEITLHLDSGSVLQSSANDMEPRKCADNAIDRLEKRLRRYKRKLKDHGHSKSMHDTFAAQEYVIETPDENHEVSDDYAPAVIAESATELKTMTVAMAVMELDLTGVPVLMFKNASHSGLNVVHRRKDGNIGWIDPSS